MAPELGFFLRNTLRLVTGHADGVIHKPSWPVIKRPERSRHQEPESQKGRHHETHFYKMDCAGPFQHACNRCRCGPRRPSRSWFFERSHAPHYRSPRWFPWRSRLGRGSWPRWSWSRWAWWARPTWLRRRLGGTTFRCGDYRWGHLFHPALGSRGHSASASDGPPATARHRPLPRQFLLPCLPAVLPERDPVPHSLAGCALLKIFGRFQVAHSGQARSSRSWLKSFRNRLLNALGPSLAPSPPRPTRGLSAPPHPPSGVGFLTSPSPPPLRAPQTQARHALA